MTFGLDPWKQGRSGSPDVLPIYLEAQAIPEATGGRDSGKKITSVRPRTSSVAGSSAGAAGREGLCTANDFGCPFGISAGASRKSRANSKIMVLSGELTVFALQIRP